MPFKVAEEFDNGTSFLASMFGVISGLQSKLFSPSVLSQATNGGEDGGETHALPLPCDNEDLALETAESLSESISILLTTAGLDRLEVFVIGLSVTSFELLLFVLAEVFLPVGRGF